MTNTHTAPADLTGRDVDHQTIGGHTMKTGTVLTDNGAHTVLVRWENVPDHSRESWVSRHALRVHPDTAPGAVCVDCVMMHANGENTAGDDWDRDAFAASGDWALNGPTDDDADDTGEFFSWSACDACGSTSGGDRFPVTFFV